MKLLELTDEDQETIKLIHKSNDRRWLANKLDQRSELLSKHKYDNLNKGTDPVVKAVTDQLHFLSGLHEVMKQYTKQMKGN